MKRQQLYEVAGNRHDVSSRNMRRKGGFTLMEVLMASVILSMAVAAISQSVISGQAHAYDSLHRMRSAALGQALMEEVSSLSYPEIEPGQPGHSAKPARRSLFDSMDDFDGYGEKFDALTDQSGREYDAIYQKYSREVKVATKTVSIAPLGDIPGLEITVIVTDERGKSWQIVRFMPRPTVEVTP